MNFLEAVGQQFAAGWIANLVAMAALVLSVLAFRKSRPRVRVQLCAALIVGGQDPRRETRSVVRVDVTNDGGTPVQIQRVYLRSNAGRVAGEASPTTQPVPCSLQPHGGAGTWLFDRQMLRATAGSDGGDRQVEFRAVVESGRARYTSRLVEEVHPQEPERLPQHHLGLRRRLSANLRGWTTPRLQPWMLVKLEQINVEAGTYELAVHNFGGGLATGATLELMRSDEVSGRRVRVGDPIPLPRIPRHGAHGVAVPLQDEDGLFWYVRYHGRAGTGVGAMTRATARRLLTEHEVGSSLAA